MTGWIILGIVLAVLLLIGLTPVGGRIACQEKELTAALEIGPLRVTLYPPKEKKEKKKPRKEKKKAREEPEKKPFSMPSREQLRYTLEVLPPVLMKALRRTRRRLRIAPLHLLLVFGGEDPADTASLYYHAEALRGAVLPALRRLVRIRDEAVTLGADYDREDIYIKGELGVRIRIGDIFLIAVSAAAGVVRWLIGYRRRADAPGAKREKEVPEGDAGGSASAA